MSERDPRAYSPGALAEFDDAMPVGSGRLARVLRVGIPAAVGLGLFIVAWQLVAIHNSDAFPPLGAIWSTLVGDLSGYTRNALITLQEVAVGLGISFVIAFSLAVLMTYVPIVEWAVMPLAVILNVTPIVAIAPGLTLLPHIGIGMAPRYMVTALIVFFPMLVNSLVGLRNIDPEALDVFETLHASRRDVLFHLRLPSSLPFLFTAARICFPLATVGAVVAEFSTSGPNSGLGAEIAFAIGQTDVRSVYASIFCLAVLGLVLTALVSIAERRLLSWHASGGARGARGR